MTEAEAVSALEHHELEGSAIQIEGSMIREFTIHILQSLHFIQNMDPIPYELVKEREKVLPFRKMGKNGINKLLILDLDECLAHCVR